MMSDGKLLEFKGDCISINVYLDPEYIEAIKQDWSKVKGIQPPLVGTHRNGLTVFIPWIMEEQDE